MQGHPVLHFLWIAAIEGGLNAILSQVLSAREGRACHYMIGYNQADDLGDRDIPKLESKLEIDIDGYYWQNAVCGNNKGKKWRYDYADNAFISWRMSVHGTTTPIMNFYGGISSTTAAAYTAATWYMFKTVHHKLKRILKLKRNSRKFANGWICFKKIDCGIMLLSGILQRESGALFSNSRLNKW